MYLDYFAFDCEPFNITPDSKFLFASTRHREAMAALLYGVEQRKGFIALTGEVGSGKTTICRALLKELDRNRIRIALVLNPQLNDVELLQAINAEFGLPHESASKRELLDILNKFLLEEFSKGHNCVLVIDESQRLSFEALEQVRLISNLELESTKLIQIALVGQPELDEMLHRPDLEQLNQRIMVRYHIGPLDLEETRQYIEHRLHIANPNTPAKFNAKAVKAIFDYSRGIPRKINVTADRALLVAFVEEKHEITGTMAQKAIDEVRGKRPSHRAVSNDESSESIEVTLPAAVSPAPEKESHESALASPRVSESGGMRALALAMIAGGVILGTVYMVTANRDDRVYAQSRTDVVAQPTVNSMAPIDSNSPVTTPTPAPTPSVQITPAPIITPEPAAQVATMVTEPTPTPTPEPIAETPKQEVVAEEAPAVPAEPWSYDDEGILRVEQPEVTFAASILTWISLTTDQRLAIEELATLREMDAEQIAKLQLTAGEPPLYLRQAQLPPSLELLENAMLPALVQVDQRAAGYGPWTVVAARNGDTLTLADSIQGSVEVDAGKFEEVLASILIPYRDEHQITNLKPGDSGSKVRALQSMLISAGVYRGEPSSSFDEATSHAIAEYRRIHNLPGGAGMDSRLAFDLINRTEQLQGDESLETAAHASGS